jgi:fusion and transport protein UGO1
VKAGITRKKANKKGQGLEGLWRGWRVGMWGLVGVWGASAIGGSGNAGGEF